MSGFEQLEQAIVSPPAEVRAEDVAWRGEDFTDEVALSIVLADLNAAESFVSSKNMPVDWERADNNFRAFGLPKNWPGVESMRAGLAMPVVMEAVEKLEPSIMLSLFSESFPEAMLASASVSNVPPV